MPAGHTAAHGGWSEDLRSTCENRYAQEDRELRLDRIFSFQQGGQELATVIGMMVWNLQIALGFRSAPPPEDTPRQQPRVDAVDERSSTFPEPCSVVSEPPIPPVEVVVPRPPPGETAAIQRELVAELAALPWAELLASRPGWAWDPTMGCLRCPDGQALHLVTIGLGHRAGGQAAAYFGTRAGACRECPLRDECLRSSTGKHHKQINVTVSAEVGQRLRALQKRLPRGTPPPARRSAPARPRRPSPPRGGHVLRPAERIAAPGPWHVLHAPFLPAEARRRCRELAGQVEIEIAIDLAQPEHDAVHPLVAQTPRERRHGRTTWAERAVRYDLPPRASARLIVVGRREVVAALLGRRPQRDPGNMGSKSARENRA